MRPTPAAHVERFTWRNDQYELALCETHFQQLSREIGAWARIATEIEPEIRPGKLLITKARELEAPTPRSVFAPTPAPGTVVVQKLPPKFHMWKLTEHAKERCVERGVNERDALLAAADPTYAVPTTQDPSEWYYTRGPISCVVNPATKEVITVIRRKESA